MNTWPTKKLGEICRPRQWPTLSKAEMHASGVPVYGANGIIGFTDKPTHISQVILIGCRGSCGTLHRLEPPAYANGNAMALDELRRNLIELNFLEHYLRYRGFDDVTTGASQPQIVQRNLNQIEIPLPPLDEQKRIAAILDQADGLRRKRQRALDRLNQLGQSIFYEMFGDPAANPKGFEAAPLRELIDFIGGSQPAKANFLYEPGPDRVRFIQIRDFRTDKYLTYVPKALAKRPFSETDVMIGRYGPPVFQIFRGLSGTYNVALMKAKPKRHLTSDFVYYLLQEPNLHRYVVANSERTAGQSGVNLELLEKYPAFVPPKELLPNFSKQISCLDTQIKSSVLALNGLEALFASLQNRAFQGKL